MKISTIKTRANIMLFLTALIWGVTFVAQKTAMNNLSPCTFNGLRCLIGSLTLFIISFFIKSKHETKYQKSYLIKGGITAGILLFFAMTLQQTGIVTSAAGKAGFISSLYIVMVPLFSVLTGKIPEKHAWLGVLSATLGLYLLCIKSGFVMERGDLTILFSAVFFALHILCIAKYAKKTDAIMFSCLQFLFAGVFAAAAGLIFETVQISDILLSAKEILYTGVLSCAIAFTLQIRAQRYVRPYIASLILSLESVFAVAASFLVLGEILTLKEISGCIFMLFAVYIAQCRKHSIYGRIAVFNDKRR